MPQNKTFMGDSALADARAFVASQEVTGVPQRKVASLKRVDSCIDKAVKSIAKAKKSDDDSPKLTVYVTVNDYGEFEKLEWNSKLLQSKQQCTS